MATNGFSNVGAALRGRPVFETRVFHEPGGHGGPPLQLLFRFSYCCHHLPEIFVRHISQLLDHLRDVFDRICIAIVSQR